jgi:hypothetical protein
MAKDYQVTLAIQHEFYYSLLMTFYEANLLLSSPLKISSYSPRKGMMKSN